MSSRRTPRLRKRPKVALVVETSLAPGREILRGIAQYVRECGAWSVYHQPRSLEESAPRWLRRWHGDGIIVRLQNRRLFEAVRASGLPAVDVLGVANDGSIPLVHVDDAAIARMACEHLHDRGFRHFGFVGNLHESFSDARRDAFVTAVEACECTCEVFEAPFRSLKEDSWEKHLERLSRWVAALPRPAGVMLCSDQRGPEVIEACRAAEISVPDEFAVIGVDNDETLCEVSQPSLSSVWPDHTRVGYRAAELLDHLMSGSETPKAPLLLAPVRVIPRLSTDAWAIEDRYIAAAVQFIRKYGCDGIGVADVVSRFPFSRSVLQRRFRNALGRTVHDEIIRVRLARARELLTETNLPMAIIAEQAGFKHQEYMGAVFKAKIGQTPAQLRRAARD